MKIGQIDINVNEVNWFQIERLTSVEIRIDIYFKNGDHKWTRPIEQEIEDLRKRLP